MTTRSVGLVRLLAAMIPATLIAGIALVGHAPAAHADETTGPVSTTIAGLAPVSLTSNSSLSLSGTISNTGLGDIGAVSVRLVLSTGPVISRAGLSTAASSDSPYALLPRYGTTTAVIDSLAPGAIVEYRLVAEAEDLSLGTPGVYVIGIEVVGYGPNGYAVLDTERTLIPYVPEPVTPVRIAWLWPLATTPSQAPDGVILGTDIPRDIAPGGRLDSLITSGESSPAITWVMDPQLLQVLASMSDGYLVDRAGRIRAGTRAAAAAGLLERIQRLFVEPDRARRASTQGREAWVMPYADPEMVALAEAGLTQDVVRASAMAPGLAEGYLGRPADGSLAWSATSRPTQAVVDLLASTGVSGLVVQERTAPPATGLAYTPSGVADAAATGGRLRLLVLDPGLVEALALPQDGPGAVLTARQRFISEIAFVAMEPASETRYLVAGAPNPRWAPNPRLLRSIIASLRSASWSRIVPVETLLDLPASASRRSFSAQTGRAREFDPGYLASLQATQERIDALRTVLTDPVPVTTPLSDALLRAESSAWRNQPRQGARLVDSIDASLKTTTGQVYVVARDDVVLSGDSGSLPVTVGNDLQQTVRVGVSVTGTPAARLEAAPLPTVEIEAGRRASLEVPVRVIGGDALTVSVQLTDPAGQPFGEPVALELRTTAYSRAALWVAIAAAAVLALLVVYDIVRRARHRSRRPEVTA